MRRTRLALAMPILLALAASCGGPPEEAKLARALGAGTCDLGLFPNIPVAVPPGGTADVELSLFNGGPDAATNVKASVTITGPATVVEFNSRRPDATCSSDASTPGTTVVTCTLPQLLAADGGGMSVLLQPTAGSGTIRVVESVTADQADPNPNDNSASGSIAIVNSVDLYAYVYAPFVGYASRTLKVSSQMGNSGPEDATSVVGTISLTGSFSDVVASPFGDVGNCQIDSSPPGATTITCAMARFPAGSGGGVNVMLTPTAQGTIGYAASITGAEVDVDPTNNSGGGTVSIAGAGTVDLAVSSGGPWLVPVGQATSWDLLVWNVGPIDATGVRLDVAFSGPAQLSGVRWPCTQVDGAHVTCDLGGLPQRQTTFVPVPFVPTAVGEIRGIATVHGDQPESFDNNNTLELVWEAFVPRLADVAVTLTDAPDPVPSVKKPLTYTITATNKGPDAASDVVVTDYLPYNVTVSSLTASQGACSNRDGWVTCGIGRLAAGGKATVTIVVSPQDVGTLYNSASANNNGGPYEQDPDESNNSATVTTTVKGQQPVVTTSFSEKVPAQGGFWVPCANDFVIVSGSLHIASQTRWNKVGGRFTYSSIANPQGLSGVGIYSGDKYQATGMTRTSQTWTQQRAPVDYSYQNNFRIIGQHKGNNLMLHQTVHVVFDKDGGVKTSVDKTTITCK